MIDVKVARLIRAIDRVGRFRITREHRNACLERRHVSVFFTFLREHFRGETERNQSTYDRATHLMLNDIFRDVQVWKISE